ncbi:MAG: hypothetical protein RMJ67_05980 [Elusimicrobiota bacterium]|nr:hypothetical protein [Endomicrobiia bacterium]MDW8166041.1 hypothetical protein [Elusimicrobiota bacterium]
MTNNKKILISIPLDVYQLVKKFAEKYGVSISKLFTISVLEKIEKVEKKSGNSNGKREKKID